MDDQESSTEPNAEHVGRLVRDNYAFVWRLLRRLGLPVGDADDAAQQVFLSVAKKLGAIQPGRERAFLYGVALHIAKRSRRSVGRRREEPLEAVEERELGGPSLERQLEQRQARRLLDQFLDQMPEDLRVVFVLFELEELTTTEIAAVCSIPAGTVASRLRRAREDFEARVSRFEARRRFRGGEP